MPPPRVFISYSHDNAEHRARVLLLANRLREDGVDARLDRYENNPTEGWPRWMMAQVADADFVVCVCTQVYRQRFEGAAPQGKGRGVNFEGLLATQVLYEGDSRTRRLVPVLMHGASPDCVPTPLRGFTIYGLEEDYPSLLERLFGRDAVPMPPIGVRMPPAPPPEPAPCQPLQEARSAGLPTRVRAADAWRALERLILELYTATEARAWVRYLDRDLAAALPGESASFAQFTTELVTALENRGLVTTGFFAEREADRRQRRGEVRAVRDLFVSLGIVEPVFESVPDEIAARAPRGVISPLSVRESPAPVVPAFGALPPTQLHLDRVNQWRDVRGRAGLPRRQAFMFHGPSDQALHLFCDRVERFIGDDDSVVGPGVDVEVVRIPTAPVMGGFGPRCDTASAWINRIANALAPQGGTLGQALADRASRAPLLLVFGTSPFREGHTPPEVFDAFLHAIGGMFADVLRSTPSAHPVHFFFSIHDGMAPAWAPRAQEALRRGKEERVWGYNHVRSRIIYPPWEDVEEYVAGYLGLAFRDEDWWARAAAAHGGSGTDYQLFAQRLHELLEEKWPGL